MKYASTAATTSGDTAVQLLAPQPGPITTIVIINTTAAGGWFQVGASGPFCFLPASSAVTLPSPSADLPVINIKRIASGTNITVYGWAY